MTTITQIVTQKRRANRVSVFIDGRFAFGCNVAVVARFRLRKGMSIDLPMIGKIEQSEIRQDCFDAATRLLGQRLHSRSELMRKLSRRKDWSAELIEQVISELERLGYVNDTRFATAKALSLAQHKKHGQRRARAELLKAGVHSEVADRALTDVYEQHDSSAIARELALKQASRLRRLEPMVARRRLAAMLQRRGFDYDAIRPVIDEVLGSAGTDEP